MIAGYHADKLRLEVEDDPEGLPNLIENPSGDLGSWGWVTPVAGTTIGRSVWGSHQFQTSIKQPCHWTSEFLRLDAGKFAAARFDLLGTSAGGNVKIQFEYYTPSKVLISMSSQSPSVSALGPHWFFPGAAAPAGTGYVKLRFVFFAGGGSPGVGDWLAFTKVMVTWAGTVADIGTSRTNLASNPIFDGASLPGWGSQGANLTRATDSPQTGTGYARLALTSTGTRVSGGIRTSPPVPISGTRDYTLSAYVRGTTDKPTALNAWFFDAAGVVVGSAEATIAPSSAWQRIHLTTTAPPSAVSVSVGVEGTQAAAGSRYLGLDSVLLEEGQTLNPFFAGTVGATDFEFSDAQVYRNLIGPTYAIDVDRDELNVGIMTAQLADAALDPARFGLIRPGRKVRLLANDLGVWRTIFTGKIGKNPTVYRKPKTGGDPARAVQISMTCVDPSSALANRAENRSVATVDALPEILEGKGVPWNCNGSGAQVTGSTVVAINENASTQDQVALTRDTSLGYAWMDRHGVLQVWDADKISTATVNHFSDLVAVPGVLSYTDIDVDYDTERCINSVKVDFLRYQPVVGQTETVPYGPYQDQVSIDTYGAQEATFTIVGLTETPAAMQAFGDLVLAANATPVIRCNSLTMPVRDAAELHTAATADLYDRQRVVYDGRVDGLHRTVGLSHRITPEKWATTLTFAGTGTVAPPTMIPAPPARVTSGDPRPQRGTVTMPAAAAGTLQSVTFPAAFTAAFTSAPVVTVNAVVADPGQYQVCAVSPTTTGFKVNLRRGASGAASIPVTWIAVGA